MNDRYWNPLHKVARGLLVADSASGPWTVLTNAPNPYVEPMRTGGRFFLVQEAVGTGMIDFRNLNVAIGLDAPVFEGVTRVSSIDFVAQLYYSPTDTGAYVPAFGPLALFGTGAGAGYWDPGEDPARAVPGIAPGESVWLVVRVWNVLAGATYEAAVAAGGEVGESDRFEVIHAGGSTPWLPPAPLLDLTSFSLLGQGEDLLDRR